MQSNHQRFILLVEYQDGSVDLCRTKDSYLCATEDNRHQLQELGDRLLDAGSIVSYQMAEMVGAPMRKL